MPTQLHSQTCMRACTHHDVFMQCEGGELFERVTSQGVLTEKAGELLLCVVLLCCFVP